MAAAMQQVIDQMNHRMTALEGQLSVALQNNALLTTQVQDLTNRLAQAQGQGGGADGGRGGLYDKRVYEPEKLEDIKDFKEWSEDFMDFINMCDEEGGP